jgi:nitrite reductase (NADH) small subunit
MTAEMVEPRVAVRWEAVCPLERLFPERGVAALVVQAPKNGQHGENVQVALFRLHDDETVYAIGNIDPFSRAAVLSRGIVGDRGGEPVVASPVYKQAFSLRTGRCLDDPEVAVPVYPVRVADGWVEVGIT